MPVLFRLEHERIEAWPHEKPGLHCFGGSVIHSQFLSLVNPLIETCAQAGQRSSAYGCGSGESHTKFFVGGNAIQCEIRRSYDCLAVLVQARNREIDLCM